MEQNSRSLFGRSRRGNVEGGRTIRHVVKTTPAEELALQARATEQRVSIARLLVESTLSGGVETISERRQLAVELTELRRLLASIANNTNQVAKYANEEGVVAEWAHDVALDYRSLRPQINSIIERLVAS